MNAGDVLTVRYKFLTNEIPDSENTNNDFAFFTLTTYGVLADINAPDLSVSDVLLDPVFGAPGDTAGTTSAKSGDPLAAFTGVRFTAFGYDGAGNEVERWTGMPVTSGAGAANWG